MLSWEAAAEATEERGGDPFALEVGPPARRGDCFCPVLGVDLRDGGVTFSARREVEPPTGVTGREFEDGGAALLVVCLSLPLGVLGRALLFGL